MTAEHGQALRALIEARAAAKMPPPMLFNVTDGSQQFVDGVVWGDLEGQVARVVIGGNYDYRQGAHVIYALPMGVGGTQEFIFLTPLWNGADGSRVPRQRVKRRVFTTDVSNPPTAAQLAAAFGTAAANKGETIIIDDAGGGSNFYEVTSDGTNWWYTTWTKAT